jgi:large conductance mechanosensitive channel
MSSFEQLAADRAKKVGSFARGFSDFAFKGNIVDLAVGVIIGAAFSGLIKSFVDNVLTPLIALVVPVEQNYREWKYAIRGQEFKYGLFLSEFLNFMLIAFVLYIFVVQFLGWLRRMAEEQKAAAPALTKDQELLIEIRDLLRQQRQGAPTP